MSVTGTKSGSQERRKHTPENFMFGKLIGEGSFSTVFLVKEIGGNERELACKVCDKRQITKEKKTKYILSEKVSIEFFYLLSLPRRDLIFNVISKIVLKHNNINFRKYLQN